MRVIISILFGLGACVGVFIGVNALINLLLDGATGDARLYGKIALWIFGFGFTLFVGIFVGWIVGNIANIFMGGKP